MPRLLCIYANKVRKHDEDFYICKKYKSFCYLNEPNLEECIDRYGSEDEEYIIYDDEDNIESNI